MIEKEQILRTFSANIKSEALSSLLDDVDQVIVKALGKSFVDAGHSMTGKLIADIETKVDVNPGQFTIDYLSYKYGAYLNSGVKANKIPFNPIYR